MVRVIRLALALAVTTVFVAGAGQAAALERVEQYGIGFPSGATGAFANVLGIAVTSDGTVVASDASQQRVSVFAQGGQFLRAFGRDVVEGGGTGSEVCTSSCKPGSSGSAAGELSGPMGIAASAERIYVAEQGNNRISAFDLNGGFLFASGANVGGLGVNFCTSSCSPGTSMSASGAMSAPNGIALAPSGELYVSDLANSRIDVFAASNGQFIRAFGKNVGGAGIGTCAATCGMGTGDGTPGSVTSPTGIAFGPEGNAFVSEMANRVSVFTPEGQFVRTFGATGSTAGQLVGPFGVAVTAGGTVYVPEIGNNRVSSFGVAGDFHGAIGLDVIPGVPNVSEACTTATGCKAGGPGFGIGEFTSPSAVAVDCRGALYVGQVGRIDKFVEPGTALPPCPPPAITPGPQPAAKPSNAFKFAKQVKNRKKGTVSITVEVPGAGALTAGAGKKFSVKAPQPTVAGSVVVTVKAAGKGVKALNGAGKLKGTLTVTFTPTGGDPATQTLAFQLNKQKKSKGKAGKSQGGKGKAGA